MFVKMERQLNEIYSKDIKLDKNEINFYNKYLDSLINDILPKLKEDKLFKKLFQEIFYGGSFYDDLRVGHPNEFDLDLLLVIPPKTFELTIEPSRPGYVKIKFKDGQEFTGRFSKFNDFVDRTKDGTYLNKLKVLSWLESKMCKIFNEIKEKQPNVSLKLKKCGPGFTIEVTVKDKTKKDLIFDVDFVPCFLFNDVWPANCRQLPEINIKSFFAVPKKDTQCSDNEFRLSFQQQERDLISNKQFLKPALKLMKRIRDNFDHPIVSYYIKTIFLWEAHERDESFWILSPLNEVFFEMLEVYCQKLEAGTIPYFWDHNVNLIAKVPKEDLRNLAKAIRKKNRELRLLFGSK